MVIVAGDLLSRIGPVTDWAPVVLVAGGAIGVATRRAHPSRLDRRVALAAIGVFLCYSAPTLLSGSTSFAGYISLDDTATWFAISDRLFDGGRSLSDLAPSSFEATLSYTLGHGYPIGAFVPLAAAAKIGGLEIAWIFQPYLALLGFALCLSIAGLARASRNLSSGMVAVAGFLSAQPAVLFAYGQWGGIKELTAAMLIVTFAATLLDRSRTGPRDLIVPGILAAAVASTLSIGGLVWLLPALAVAVLSKLRGSWPDGGLRRILPAALVLAALALALVAGVGALPQGSVSSLLGGDTLGNLIEPLSPWQLVGVWPAGDFRLSPDHGVVTGLLIALVIALAAFGAISLRKQPRSILTYGLGTLLIAIPLIAFSSPWLAAKTLAIASPAVVLLAICGVAALPATARAERTLVLALVAFGIIWSNWLAYREVDLAPHDRFAELRTLGGDIAGRGPTLLAEYEPYATRHFLRDADPESPGELRRRRIPMRDGRLVDTGASADLDQLRTDDVIGYRTIVTRRSPFASRPPAPFHLLERGDWYEAWTRSRDPAIRIVEHVPLDGSPFTRCARARGLARLARRSHAKLIVALQPRTISVPLTGQPHPSDWVPSGGGGGELLARSGGDARLTFELDRGGPGTVWLGGSIRGAIDASLDGQILAESIGGLDHEGHFVRLGGGRLDAGTHTVELDYHASALSPGTAEPSTIGPLVISFGNGARTFLVPTARASDLCGLPLDWIEVADLGLRRYPDPLPRR